MTDMALPRLLYIEDEEAHIGLLVRLLNPYWEVRAAISFAEAQPLLEERWPDIVLLDLQLGLASAEGGFEALRIIKESYPSLPVVVTSVTDYPRWIQRAMDTGAAAFIRKPVNVETIGTQLRRFVAPAR